MRGREFGRMIVIDLVAVFGFAVKEESIAGKTISLDLEEKRRSNPS